MTTGEQQRDARDDRDVVIVGGGPAGLSAALVLGRARQRVLVVDADRPSNSMVGSIGGLLAFGGSPRALKRAGRKQLREFPNVEVVDGLVLDAQPDADGVTVTVARDEGVETVRSRVILMAQGLRYEPPNIPGVAPLWGHSVFHCVFCDGWEVAGRPIAMHANGEGAARLARLAAGWSDDVLLVTDGPADITDDERAELDAAGVRIREERIVRLESRRRQLKRIVFESGPAEEREALFIRPTRSQPSLLHERAGLEQRDDGLIATSDGGGRTDVERVYVAGDSAASVRNVAIAIGNGSRVATAMAADLIVDRYAQAPSSAIA
jgi:thioredoxin reductase